MPEANNLYHGKMTAIRKYDRIFNWHFCNNDLIGHNQKLKCEELPRILVSPLLYSCSFHKFMITFFR